MNTQPEDRPLADLVADLMQPLMAYAAWLGSRPRTWPWKRPAGRCEYGGKYPQNP